MPGTWARWFKPESRRLSRGDRRSRSAAIQQHRAADELTARVGALEEQNRKLESINRIQQVEIDEPTAVVARNLERVKAETRALGHAENDRAPLTRMLTAEQEMDQHD
jgi:hypothetical protein